MNKLIILLFSFFLISGCSSIKETNSSKNIQVYTSANQTNLRLSKSDTLLYFKEMKQPLETQVCIFVSPNKKFQTFLGIGGAITDASAEVFANLSTEKQQE